MALPGSPAADAAHRRRTWTCSPTSASTPAAGSRPPWAGRTRLAQLSPGRRRRPVHPGRRRRGRPRGGTGSGDAPVVVCVSRLVAAQGPGRPGGRLAAGAGPPSRRPAAARRRRPGGGVAAPGRRRPRAGATPSSSPVPVPRDELPAHYAAGDVFAMPCRTRRAGLDVEGLGHGLPRGRRLRPAGGRRHVRRRAGGGPGGRHRARRRPAVARRRRGARSPTCSTTPTRARAMGAAGRAWVEQRWSWTTIAADLRRRCSSPDRDSTEPRPARRGTGLSAVDSAGVEPLDLGVELLHDDGALELEARRQHPVVLGEVRAEDRGTS